jgi:hypothetical protein
MADPDDGKSGVSLPGSRSFVVQFSGATRPSANRFTGRAEHIESGRCGRFATLAELVVFLVAVLEKPRADDDAD